MVGPDANRTAVAHPGGMGALAHDGGFPVASARDARSPWDKAALALMGLVLALLLNAAWRVGPTIDEHYYAATGLAYVASGDFSANREHPPLLKVLMGASLRLSGLEVPEHWRYLPSFQAGFFYGVESARVQRNLFIARLPMILLTLVLVASVWRIGRRWFGPRAGFAGAAFLGLNPSLLAHGPQAALDAGTTTLIFLALIAFVRALERPEGRRVLAAAVLFGLANLTKFTALLLGPALIALALIAAVRERSGRPLTMLVQVLFGGLTVFAAGYLFEAKSINEAWSGPGYRTTVPPDPIAAPGLAAAVGQELSDPGPWREVLEEAARAPSAEVALERLLSRLREEASPVAAADLAGALLALENRPGPLRLAAVEALLETPGLAVPAERVLEVVPRLAERTLLFPVQSSAAERLARWADWLEEERFSDWNERILIPGPVERMTRGWLGDTRPIPLLTVIKGLEFQTQRAQRGHSTHFRGRVLHPIPDFEDGNPHPEYYSVVLAIKNPIGFLLATLAGLLLAIALPWRFGALRFAACVGFPLLLMLVFSTSNVLAGVRYVLPIFPFLALLAARFVAAAPRIGLGLLLLAAGESLWIHPNELMYYNLLAGGPRHGPAISSMGDDIGQGVKNVAGFAARHRAELEAAGWLRYNPQSPAEPSSIGLGETLPFDGPVQGIVAVHVLDLHRWPERFGWLADYEPFVHLGWSVLIFDTRSGPPGGDPGWR